MNGLPLCCMDFDIDPRHLIFPEELDEDGKEFLQVHGLEGATLAGLREGAISMPGGKIKIKHRCPKLTDDGLCSIYFSAEFPSICRDFACGRPECGACKGERR